MTGTPDLLTETPGECDFLHMDALSDVLRVVGLTGGVFLDARFTAPWCIVGKVAPEFCKPFMTPPAYVISFHYIVEGRCFIAVDGEAPCQLEAGDAILLPHNQQHRLGSDLDVKAIPAADLVAPPEGIGVSRLDHGGGGAPCMMVCGFLGGDEQLKPLITTLPPLMKISLTDSPGGQWMSHSFRFGAQQLANGDPGAATIMSKTSELLFVEAVRRHLTAMPAERTGFLAGLRDPAVGRALGMLHSQVTREWTVDDLAAAVHMSRSAFADRFLDLMGQPPMKYLTNWRMQVAAQKLREGRLTVGQIAFDIGYESEAAFARAFKREMGTPPATWRKRAVAA